MLGEDQKKGLHFRNPQTSTGSIRLVYHKALYTAGFKVKTKKRSLYFRNPHISAGSLSHFLLLRYGCMHISPFVDVCKKIPSDPKEFSGDPILSRYP